MPGRAVLVIVLALVLVPTALYAEVSISDPSTFVVDTAGVIDDPVERQLEGWLRELKQKTTAQVKVLTVATTEGEDIFSFVHRHAESWKLGQKGKDNGALIAVALKERRVRIHTGYGLEGALPDSWAGSLSRAVASQFFKQGQFSQGLLQLTIATANKVADAQQVKLTGIPQYRYRPGQQGGSGTSLGVGIFPLLILFAILSSMRRRRRYYNAWGGGGMMGGLLMGSVLGSTMGGRRSHWGGAYSGGFGGGFGGGSFGGGGGGASW